MTSDVPAWLDLDMIVPTELRFRMRGLAGRLEELGPLLAELASESIAIRDAFEAAVRDADAGAVFEEVSALSGFDTIWNAWIALIERACDVTESVPV